MPATLGSEASRIDEFLGKLTDLPPMPASCLKLGELIQDPNCEVADLARIIEQDAGIATRLLKLANSAFYSVPGGVHSVQRAVQFIGFSAIHQLVLCLQSHAILNQSGSQPPPWLAAHSMGVAVLTQQLANTARIPGREVSLAAGLLHDVGRLAAFTLAPKAMELYAAKVAAGANHSRELEIEVLGVDHEEIGRRIAERWKYPKLLVQVISDHHGEGAPPAAGATDDAQRMCDLVAIADAWSHSLGRGGFGEGPRSMTVHESRLQRTKLPPVPAPDQRKALQAALDAAQSF